MESAQEAFANLRTLEKRTQQWAFVKGVGVGLLVGLLTHLLW